MTDVDLPSRLLRGAGVLGKMWAEGFKCASGWSAGCSCNPPTRFCDSKKRYWDLLVEAGRETGDPKDPFALILAMRIAEVVATDLVLVVEFKAIGRVEVGRGGQLSWQDLVELSKRPEGGAGVLQVLAKFPSSTMEPTPDAKKTA